MNKQLFSSLGLMLTLVMTACGPDPDLNGNRNDLVETVWVKELTEVYDATTDTLVEQIFPLACESQELIKFDRNNRLLKQVVCEDWLGVYALECNYWRVRDGEMTIVGGSEPILEEECRIEAMSTAFAESDVPVSLDDDRLMIQMAGFDDQDAYLSSQTVQDVRDGKKYVKTFYARTQADIEGEPGCCLE